MKFTLVSALCVLCVVDASGSHVTPVQKVVEMLQGLLKKGAAEKHAEQVQFAGFKRFCDDVTVEKQKSIDANKAQVEMLSADIQKYEAEVARLEQEMQQHDADIAVWTKDLAAAKKVRKEGRSNYMAQLQDLTESVEALGQAISTLKQQNFDRPGASGLLQTLKAFPRVPEEVKRAIEAFAQQDPEMEPFAAPSANAYEFQSTAIIEMLEKLEVKFKDEKTAMEEKEVADRAAFDVLQQDLQNSVRVATGLREDKAQAKAKDVVAIAENKADLADTVATMEASQKYLDDLTATCTQKSEDFAKRQELRAQELQALEKAVEIIGSEAVKGAAEKHLPAALLQHSPSTFAQLRSTSSGQDGPNKLRVAAFLRYAAERLGSRVLSTLATRAQADPFAKVKQLIQELLNRLMAQATDEAEHKGWCDTELATNEHTRKSKAARVEELRSEIDELNASVAKLTEEMADLSASIEALDASVAQATEIRDDDKKENGETISDAKAAQAAVAEAIKVLKDFYQKAGEATALLQQDPSKEDPTYGAAPEIFDAPYKGMQNDKGGVVGMLEVIQSDFSRLEADTSASEQADQGDYDKFMTDSEVEKAQMDKDLTHKTTQKHNQEGAVTEKTDELGTTEQQLDLALASYAKLKPACEAKPQTYAERKANRKEEIEALKEALRILSGDDIAALTQQ